MSTRNTDSKIRQTLLTPCRQVGLKRKSLSNTPRGSNSPNTPVTILQSSSLSLESDNNITPVRHVIGSSSVTHTEKKLKLNRIKPKTILEDSPLNKLNVIETSVEDGGDIDLQIEKITDRISEKTTKLSILESECKNVKQHDLSTLNSLISKWRNGCQTALNELLCEYTNRGENCTMVILLQTLGIPFELVQFSETETDFRN